MEKRIEIKDPIINSENVNSDVLQKEPSITVKNIKSFISRAAKLNLKTFRCGHLKWHSHQSELSEEEKKELKANIEIPDNLSNQAGIEKLVDILLSINKDNARDYGIDPERLDETKFIVSRMMVNGDSRKKIVNSIDTNIRNDIMARDIVIHTMYGGITQTDIYVKNSKFLKDPQKFAKVYEIIASITADNIKEYGGNKEHIIKHKFILSRLCTCCYEYKKFIKDILKDINDNDILNVYNNEPSEEEKELIFNYLPPKLKVELRGKAFITDVAKLSLVNACHYKSMPEFFADYETRECLMQEIKSINQENAKNYGIEPEHLDKKKFIISLILETALELHGKAIRDSINSDVKNDMTAKEIVVRVICGGIKQYDANQRYSDFLLADKSNFDKFLKIATNITADNIEEYGGNKNDIIKHKFILSLLCMKHQQYKERGKDILKDISDDDIYKMYASESPGEEKEIMFRYLSPKLQLRIQGKDFITNMAKLNLLNFHETVSASNPEFLKDEEERKESIKEIKSINKENAKSYGIDVSCVDEKKFILSHIFSGKERCEIQDSISDRAAFNELQIRDIVIQMIKENEQNAGNVPKKYEEFLSQNERVNEKLLLETVAKINKDNASQYGITKAEDEDLDKKKFIVSSFFNDEEGRSKVGQSIGEEKLLDIFFKMSEVEKMTYFRGLPRSTRTVKTLERALGNTRWWKDGLNKETGKIEPTNRKKFFLEQAVDYIDPDNNNQNHYAGGYNNRGRFDFAEYMRQMNNLFQNMFVQWQMRQQQQMQQRFQQPWQYNQYQWVQAQQRQMQIQQQRMQQMQMFNTDNEERELNQLMAQRNQLNINLTEALNDENQKNRLNELIARQTQLESEYNNHEKTLSDDIKSLIYNIKEYMSTYNKLPEYAKSQTANNSTSLYSICERLLNALNHEDVLSSFNSVQNVSDDIQRIQAVQMLSFNSKMVYAKNFGLSLYYFFGIDAFIHVIKTLKNRNKADKLNGNNNKYQFWGKLFIVDAFAFLIGISMIGLFAFINLTMIAYIFIAIVAAEQLVTTILKLYRLNHMSRFILKKQAVSDHNKATELLVNNIKDFLSGHKSQEYSNLISVKTELNDVNNSINELQNEVQSRQSQAHPNIDAAQIRIELNNISNRITMLTNQINLKKQQQRQFFGTTNNNMFGARIPNMYNNYGTGFNGFNNGFNNYGRNNNGFGY